MDGKLMVFAIFSVMVIASSAVFAQSTVEFATMSTNLGTAASSLVKTIVAPVTKVSTNKSTNITNKTTGTIAITSKTADISASKTTSATAKITPTTSTSTKTYNTTSKVPSASATAVEILDVKVVTPTTATIPKEAAEAISNAGAVITNSSSTITIVETEPIDTETMATAADAVGLIPEQLMTSRIYSGNISSVTLEEIGRGARHHYVTVRLSPSIPMNVVVRDHASTRYVYMLSFGYENQADAASVYSVLKSFAKEPFNYWSYLEYTTHECHPSSYGGENIYCNVGGHEGDNFRLTEQLQATG
ncbi:MAG: hypothetical protein NT051_06460 [Candidatus Micrarchaeota archaeon]|nr:hypothetical protein [Candidatus Micrarchaeota archaeon]